MISSLPEAATLEANISDAGEGRQCTSPSLSLRRTVPYIALRLDCDKRDRRINMLEPRPKSIKPSVQGTYAWATKKCAGNFWL